jgi:phosphopantothenoylcysteine decarboxylase/phosphopantothenate--cysteine ligase
MSLKGKNIVIGVCGSIAAYKIATLVRLLVKGGAKVQILMTVEATQFITPLTLSTLSNKPVLVDYFDKKTGEWNNHVHIGLEADLLLFAPLTANTLAKLANGLCDSLLTAVYLSAKCPVFYAPAMDLDMWKHPSTVRNITSLNTYGNVMIHPGNGELASGLIGEGRLAEPEEIFKIIHSFFGQDKPLKGKKALVTAGPTYEAIDPVRFIGNHSSGKMGYAIAQSLTELGADVILVSGPTALDSPLGVHKIAVTSAAEMYETTKQYFDTSDIIVMSAAVADYTPQVVSDQKIKKKEETFSIDLKKTIDILATLGVQKRDNQVLVGFALETNNELENARTKLLKKNLDFIVLNSMRDSGAGFANDTNKITIIAKDGNQQVFTLKSKTEVARDVCNAILDHPAIKG